MSDDERLVRCNECGFVGEEGCFPHGHDFFQHSYVRACPADGCDNRQSPGDASMRMMPGQESPFSYVDREDLGPMARAVDKVVHRSQEAS